MYVDIFMLVNILFVFITPQEPLKGCATRKSSEDF